MKNFKLQIKSIERNKFQRILLIAIFLLFTAFLIYTSVYGVPDMDSGLCDFLQSTLYPLPLLIIFFVFYSFESCYSIKFFSESVCTTKKGLINIYKTQMLITTLAITVLTAEAIIFNLLFNIIKANFNIHAFLHICSAMFFYFFGGCITAAFIGLMLSQLKKRYVSYIIMVLMAICEAPVMEELSTDIFDACKIDITKILMILNFVPSSLNYQPNYLSGITVEIDKVELMLFWIFFSILVFTLCRKSINSKSKKYAKSIICAALCISLFAGYMAPFSTRKTDLSASGVFLDQEYYADKATVQLSEEANYKVLKYDINFSAYRNLKASVKIYVDAGDLDEYKFTLYRNFKIKSITDQNGEKLDFTQNEDYFTIFNSKKDIEYFNIKYSGDGHIFYSNYASACLPGYFAYYPIPGFKQMHSSSGDSYFFDNSLPYEVEFDVIYNSLNKVYSNLNQTAKNKFSGKSKSLTLISGYIEEAVVHDTTIYYPYFVPYYNDEFFKSKTADFISEHPELKKVFIMPSLNLNQCEQMHTYDDYFLTTSVLDIEEAYIQSRVPQSRWNQYIRTDIFSKTDDPKAECDFYINEFKLIKTEEEKEYIRLLCEIALIDDDGQKLEAAKYFIINDNDDENFNKNFIEFLKTLR